MPVVLAVDVGSSFAKAQRFDDTGRAVGELHRVPTGLSSGGCADAIRIAETVDGLIDAAVADIGAVDGVAVSSAWHTLVGVDGDDSPTTELSTWIDGRSGADAAQLRGAVADADDAHHRTGAPIHPSLPPARLAWIRRHRPDAFAATRRWCSLPEFLAARWFGEQVGPSSAMASASGLYDQRRRAWDAELSELLHLPAGSLAAVENEPQHTLAHEYRTRWPALHGVPWFPAVGDGACATVGEAADRSVLTVGTSAAVRVLCDRETRFGSPLPPALFGYLVDDERAVVGAARSNAGNVVEFGRRILGVSGDDPVAAATDGRPPGAHGLRADASLVVERSPDWPLTSTASVLGLRNDTTALDVLQALLESAAAGIATAIAALEEWTGPSTTVLGGGASTSPAWQRLLRGAIGRPLVVSAVPEASARGAALLAFERMG